MRNLILYFFLLGAGHLALAQDDEEYRATGEVKVLDFSVVKINGSEDKLFLSMDTNEFHFIEDNPVFWNLHSNLGNFGSSSESLRFLNLGERRNISLGENNWDVYDSWSQRPLHLRATAPFTVFKYRNGPKQEQGVEIFHSQNINEYWNSSIDYKKISRVGYYNVDDRSSVSDFHWANTVTKGKYFLLSDFRISSIVNAENGGLVTDSVFTDNTLPNRDGVNMYLEDAENNGRLKSVDFLHGYRFSSGSENDTLSDRSSITTVYNSVKVYSNKYYYKDNAPDTGYYENYFDSREFDQIRDSIGVRGIDFSVGLTTNRYSWITPEITYDIELVSYSLFDAKMLASNHSVSFKSGDVSLSKRIKINEKGYYSFLGYNAGGYSNTLGLSYGSDSTLTLTASFLSSRSAPSLKVNRYVSSVFDWSTDFDFSNTNTLLISLSKNQNIGLYVFVQNDQGYVYFDELSRPTQLKESFTSYGVGFDNSFQLKNVGGRLNVIYQQLDESALNFPDFAGYGSMWWTARIFRNALKSHIGFELFYNTDYYANEYFTLTRAFHVQNEVKTGGYLYLNGFLNVKIKSTTVFVSMSNILQGVLPYNYIMTPHYPMEDRSIRFGFEWDLWN